MDSKSDVHYFFVKDYSIPIKIRNFVDVHIFKLPYDEKLYS